MSTNISNGYDTDVDMPSYSPSKDDGSVSYKAEFSASISASASQSCKINNTYSFNLSFASFSVNAGINDSSWLGASFSVAYGIPPTFLSFMAKPTAKATAKQISTKNCITYEYSNEIHHRGDSLSLRAYKVGIDAPIPENKYGRQDIIFAGGNRIDITASVEKSAEAKTSLSTIQTLIGGMAAIQTSFLVVGCIPGGKEKGATGLRLNTADSMLQSGLITGGAIALSMTPFIAFIAMAKADSKTQIYEDKNLKGKGGFGNPNDKGILLDACEPVSGGEFIVQGKEILLKSENSSLKFNQTIDMKGANNCSFATSDSSGMFLDPSSIKVKAGNDACMSVDGTGNIKLQKGDSSVKLTSGGVTALSLKVSSGGVSMPGATYTNGTVDFA